MGNSTAEVLQLYHWIYARPSKPQRESAAFRRRLLGYLQDQVGGYEREIAQNIKYHIGSEHLRIGDFGVMWTDFFTRAPMPEILSTISIAARALRREPRRHAEWIAFVRNVIDTEHMDFVVTEEGIVQPRVDQAFQVAKALMIEALSAPHLSAVSRESEEAFAKLGGSTPDYPSAIRGLFVAAETIFMLIKGKGTALDKKAALELIPLAEARYKGPGNAALRAANSQVSSFAAWVDACQPFRHGHKAPEPVEIPDDLAICLINSAAVWLRWLSGFPRIASQ